MRLICKPQKRNWLNTKRYTTSQQLNGRYFRKRLQNQLEYLSGLSGEDIEKLTVHVKRNFNKANYVLLSLNVEIDKRLAEMKNISKKQRAV